MLMAASAIQIRMKIDKSSYVEDYSKQNESSQSESLLIMLSQNIIGAFCI